MARTSLRLLSMVLAGTALLALAACYVGSVRPARTRLGAHRVRAEALRREYSDGGRRWVRPVLRGVARDCNAIDEQQRALAALGPLSLEGFRANREALRSGGELPAQTRALLREPRVNEALDRLRASTQCAWAWNAYAFLPNESAPRVLGTDENRATLLLLARARERPAECLEVGADVLRVAQDGAAGPGFFNLALPVVLSVTVSAVAMRCASGAPGGAPNPLRAEELLRASREFASLSEAPSHLGESTEIELYTFALGLLEMEPRVSWVPFLGSDIAPLLEGRSGERRLDALRGRVLLLDGIDRLLRPTDVWSRVSREGHPAARASLERELSQRLGSNPITAGLLDLFRRNMGYDATAQARLRALSWALRSRATALEGEARGDSPSNGHAPIDVSAPPRDPFDGAPLRVRARAPAGPAGGDGAPARVWSVGPDGTDQQGSTSSDDVAVEIP